MLNYQITPRITFTEHLYYEHPEAVAWIVGNTVNPQLSGLVKFYQTSYGGVLIEAEIFGLPNISLPDSSNFYAIHIHETGDCSDNFEKTGSHYNPSSQEHPYHAGDMPPLLAYHGYAFMVFYDRRFTIPEVLGRSVVIHEFPDDFTTQPSGNSGKKIGCGEIKPAVSYTRNY